MWSRALFNLGGWSVRGVMHWVDFFRLINDKSTSGSGDQVRGNSVAFFCPDAFGVLVDNPCSFGDVHFVKVHKHGSHTGGLSDLSYYLLGNGLEGFDGFEIVIFVCH